MTSEPIPAVGDKTTVQLGRQSYPAEVVKVEVRGEECDVWYRVALSSPQPPDESAPWVTMGDY